MTAGNGQNAELETDVKEEEILQFPASCDLCRTRHHPKINLSPPATGSRFGTPPHPLGGDSLGRDLGVDIGSVDGEVPNISGGKKILHNHHINPKVERK